MKTNARKSIKITAIIMAILAFIGIIILIILRLTERTPQEDIIDWKNEIPAATAEPLPVGNVTAPDEEKADNTDVTAEILPDDTVIDWKDKNLEAAIRKTTGIYDRDIVYGDVKYITYLSLPEDISDISALSTLVNLEELNWSFSHISDISALSTLVNLKELNLSYNHISDISALSSLTNLKILNLDNNSVSDISPLSTLVNLTTLDLWGNGISDISALSNLTNLEELKLWGNNISDISPLSSLTNLNDLNLYSNNISDISPLSNLVHLNSLDLRSNLISDISPLSSLVNLRHLRLNDNNISDISPLSTLVNLDDLYLRFNNISDASPLYHLRNLNSADLFGNDLGNIRWLIDLQDDKSHTKPSAKEIIKTAVIITASLALIGIITLFILKAKEKALQSETPDKKPKAKKIIKIIIIIFAILTLIWMIGIRLLIWHFAKQEPLAPPAQYFTEYQTSLENGQTISHNGISMKIPAGFVEDKCIVDAANYRNYLPDSWDESGKVIIMAPSDDRNLSLFGESFLAEMDNFGFLGKIGAHKLMKGFEALGHGIPDSHYALEKATYLLTEDDYSFSNWKQGFAYVVTQKIAKSTWRGNGDCYIYEREDICGYLQIFAGTNKVTCNATMFDTTDLNTSYTITITGASLEEVYGMINSIVIE